MPRSVEGIKRALRRDRRDADRRGDKLDRRIFPRERRVGERRVPVAAARTSDTDPHIQMPDFGDLIIEISDADMELVEQTMVRGR